MGTPWNPPYYSRLLAGAGLRKLADAFSARVPLDLDGHREMVDNLYPGRESKTAEGPEGEELRKLRGG